MIKYIKEDLERMLKEHLKNQSKLTEIELKKSEYETKLRYAGTVYEDTDKEVIENMQLAGQPYSEIHSNTNKVTDKVSSTVMNYHKELIHINKEDRVHIENKIKELDSIKEELDKKIVRVENMIVQLSSEEKFVITKYYMEKSKWDYVSQQYCIEFQKPKSINQLLNIRDIALDSMLDILNTGI